MRTGSSALDEVCVRPDAKLFAVLPAAVACHHLDGVEASSKLILATTVLVHHRPWTRTGMPGGGSSRSALCAFYCVHASALASAGATNNLARYARPESHT